MPLGCKSLMLSPAQLAAQRANAQKSTGPRSARGKARSSMNSLSHGRYATRMPGILAEAGDVPGERDFRWIQSKINEAFSQVRPLSPSESGRVAQITTEVWCAARRALRKPAPAANSALANRGRVRIACQDFERGVRLIFWTRSVKGDPERLRSLAMALRETEQQLPGEAGKPPRRALLENLYRVRAYRIPTLRELQTISSAQALLAHAAQRRRALAASAEQAAKHGEMDASMQNLLQPSAELREAERISIEVTRLVRRSHFLPFNPAKPDAAAQRQAKHGAWAGRLEDLVRTLHAAPEVRQMLGAQHLRPAMTRHGLAAPTQQAAGPAQPFAPTALAPQRELA
jgi:hypothetical protein